MKTIRLAGSWLVLGGMLGVALASAGAGKPKPMVAQQPPAAFARCTVCHTVNRGGAAGMGPNLFGIGARKLGSKPGYAYSTPLKKSPLVWTRVTLVRFLANPGAVAPGTTMPNPGLRTRSEQNAVAVYLLGLK